MSIIVNGKIKEYKDKLKVIDLVEENSKDIITCKINNKLRDLSYIVEDNCNIELLGFDDEDSIRVYEASLRYLFVMALKKVFPSFKVNCDYYASRSICFKMNDKEFNKDEFEIVSDKMKEIVSKDYPFIRETMTLEEAKKYYSENCFEDKVEVFKYRKDKEVHIYKCDDYVNYMYSYMVPSTGYLNKYKLILHKGMILLQYPRAEENGEIPEFVEETTYEDTLKKASEWGKKVGSLTVSSINNNVISNPKEFIEICEKRHADLIKELADKICERGNIKLIAIAGPSSSGKTTFSNKLRIELESRGIYPVKLSMDDYYLDRSHLKIEDEKNFDFENINLINIPLFNKHLKELTDGKEVTLPRFDFATKKSLMGKTIKLKSNAPIIIEGIHALNEVLTSSLPRENKFEIYIGPHIQINIDDHNPISITHLRLIRRLVRDYRTRGSSVARTLGMWDSVRKGEFKWIYENQEGVDFVYNSVLDYEFCVMKKYALPLLREVKEEESFYNLSRTLIKYLKYFIDIDDEFVPENSLLREFIGGSIYEE